jgi:hypothetical protein
MIVKARVLYLVTILILSLPPKIVRLVRSWEQLSRPRPAGMAKI